ncbi:MAG TPA: hypothetical protein VGC42_02330 [Kofleriaceae bacterium]
MTRIVMLTAGALVLALGGVARADQADTLFKKGKKLLGEKRYAEACSAFAESDRLDPGIGAKLNVARCYQEWGKLATAYRWYAEAEQLARQLKDERAAKIRGLIDELERQVPRLTVRAADGAVTAGADITLDGKPLDAAQLGSALPVDPGPHEIAYLVDGKRRDQTVPLERGGNAEITLALPVKRRKPPRRAAEPREASAITGTGTGTGTGADPGHAQKLVGLAAGGAGVVALGVAGLVTLRAHGDYQHAIDHHCAGSKTMCDDVGLTATDNARHRANIATVITIGGVAAIAAGVVVYLIAPRAEPRDEHALYLTPSVERTGGALVLGGRF